MTELLSLFNHLEKAAVHGPGRHELVRMFFAHQERAKASADEHPFYVLTDPYGRVLVTREQFEKVRAELLPPVSRDITH